MTAPITNMHVRFGAVGECDRLERVIAWCLFEIGVTGDVRIRYHEEDGHVVATVETGDVRHAVKSPGNVADFEACRRCLRAIASVLICRTADAMRERMPRLEAVDAESDAQLVARCEVTGNPCGTDTRMAGAFCLCASCRSWQSRQS